MESKTIQVDSSDIKIIEQFVEESYMSNVGYYKKRNQNNVEKIKQDIFNGKLAEFAVYYLYKDNENCEINIPDTEVYESFNKSFEADLFCKFKDRNFYIHVKSQHVSQAERFGKSWSFQKEDSLTTRPVAEDRICLCNILNGNTVEVIKPILAKKLVNIYKDPKLDRLKGIKKVIYYQDLI